MISKKRPSVEQKEQGKFNQVEEGKLELTKIFERLEKSMKPCLDGVLAAVQTQWRPPRERGCWNCGDLNHVWRNCPHPCSDDKGADEEGNGK